MFDYKKHYIHEHFNVLEIITL